jgi:hypothetical protein
MMYRVFVQEFVPIVVYVMKAFGLAMPPHKMASGFRFSNTLLS